MAGRVGWLGADWLLGEVGVRVAGERLRWGYCVGLLARGQLGDER